MQKSAAIGIMDQAYFVPKKQILSWLNRTLKLDVPVIEDLGTGSVYCQLLDAGFGQRVPMHKINWKAKFQYEFICNLKVFQQAMQKIGIMKKIDIEKLAKAKYQDNLQLIQWLKRYIQLNGNILQDYKAEQRRNGAVFHSITIAKKALTTSFKTNTSFMSASTTFLNSSVCSIMTTTKPSKNNINNTSSIKPKTSNKQNHYNEDSKQLSQKIIQQMNQIKKVLLSSQEAQQKLDDIHKIVFGSIKKTMQVQPNNSNLMQIEAELVESDDQVLVF